MAKIKQFTISVENRPGAVAEIAKALGNAKVNVLSLLGTAQGARGTIELVAEDARRAKKALDAAQIPYQETAAEECELPNKAGALAQCLRETRRQGVQPKLDSCDSLEGRAQGGCLLQGVGRSKSGAGSIGNSKGLQTRLTSPQSRGACSNAVRCTRPDRKRFS